MLPMNPFEGGQLAQDPGALSPQEQMLLAQSSQIQEQPQQPQQQAAPMDQDMQLLEALTQESMPHLMDKMLRQMQEEAESKEREGKIAGKVKNVIKNLSDLQELSREQAMSNP